MMGQPSFPLLGYNFNFPFLSNDVKVNVSSFRVHPLYKHVISVHHPTLSFLGLCTMACPFPQFHLQAAFVKSSLDGSLKLPSAEEMLADEAADLEYRWVFLRWSEFQLKRLLTIFLTHEICFFCSTEELGWPERHAHRMHDLQWAYNDWLAEISGICPLPKMYEDLYYVVWKRRMFDVLGYRRDNYDITDDGCLCSGDECIY